MPKGKNSKTYELVTDPIGSFLVPSYQWQVMFIGRSRIKQKRTLLAVTLPIGFFI